LRAENALLKARIISMEASKFWKIRNAWFYAKERLRESNQLRRQPDEIPASGTGVKAGVASSPTRLQEASIAEMRWMPTLSILLPLSRPPSIGDLETILVSLKAQSYKHWELCVAHTMESQSNVDRIFSAVNEGKPGRIRVREVEDGLIPARAANSTLELATGEFIVLPPLGKTFAVNALYEIAQSLNAHPDDDIIVAQASGTGAYRRSLVLEAHGFDPATSDDIDAHLAAILRHRGARVSRAVVKVFAT